MSEIIIMEKDKRVPKCVYRLSLINLGIPSDVAYRTGMAVSNDDPGVKGYELLFANDYNKEFWVFSFNYTHLANTYTVRRVRLPENVGYAWWTHWMEYVRFADFDVNYCFVNIIPLHKELAHRNSFDVPIKDRCTDTQYEVGLEIAPFANRNIAKTAIKKKIKLNEENIGNFSFDFYEHFEKVGKMPMNQNIKVAMDHKLKDCFTLEVDKKIEMYKSQFVVGGMVHILKSANFRYREYGTMEEDDSSLLVYGIDRQNLIYKVVDNG